MLELVDCWHGSQVANVPILHAEQLVDGFPAGRDPVKNHPGYKG
jgi:hypothetical protein